MTHIFVLGKKNTGVNFSSVIGCFSTFIKIRKFLSLQGGKGLSDGQRAFVIMVGFTLFALLVAVAVQQIMAWAPS